MPTLRQKVASIIAGKAGIPSPSQLMSYETGLDANGKVAFFYGFSTPAATQDTRSLQGQMSAYNYCPSVAGIINRKARAHTNGIWSITDQDGNPGKGSQADYLTKLLAKPNILQTRRQFEMQAQAFLQLFGECFIFALTPAGTPTTRLDQAKALWIIPNWIINPIRTGKQYMQTDQKEITTGYRIGAANEDMSVIPPEFICHIKDQGINTWYNLDNLRGQSRLFSLQAEVSNIIAALEARGSLITNRGAVGLISSSGKDANSSIPLTPKEVKALEDQFINSHGLTGGRSTVKITASAAHWQSMIAPTKDLMLFEEVADDIRSIAFSYDYPQPLLGFTEGTTFSNMQEAKKLLYQDAIIPEATSFTEALTCWPILGMEKSGLKLISDYSHLDILQQSEKDKADSARFLTVALTQAYQAGVITMEEYRAAIAVKFGIDPDKINGATYFTGTPQPISEPKP